MIYAIGDLHFDYTKDKSMDVFGDNWKNHEEKIINSWKEKVNDDDLVLILGDTSWGLKLEEGYEDLKRIDILPGKKVIIKGNHDYWWSSKNKLENLDLKTIHFLFNDSVIYEDFYIFGTRGWLPKDYLDFTEDDEKIYVRELNRLKNSYNSKKSEGLKKIALIHYPPFNFSGEPNEFFEFLSDKKVDFCLYGHLHGDGHSLIKEGIIDGIDVRCVSSDYLNFNIIKIA